MLIGLLIALPAWSQTVNVRLMDETGRSSHEVRIDSLPAFTQAALAPYVANGYLEAELHFTRDSAGLIARLDPGTTTTLQHIHFDGLDLERREELRREFLLYRESIGSQELPMAVERLQARGWWLTPMPVLTRDEKAEFHASYQLQRVPDLVLDGSLGINRERDSLIWIGEVQAGIPALGRVGRNLKLDWRRYRRDSEFLQLRYREPGLFQQPLYFDLDLMREVVAGQYQQIDLGLALAWHFSWTQSLQFKLERERSLITLDGQLLNPEWRDVQRSLAGLVYQNRDLIGHSRHGLGIRSAYARELNTHPDAIKRLRARIAYVWSGATGLTWRQEGGLVLQQGGNADSDPSYLQTLGGTRTVRGHMENEIRAPSILFLRNELHLRLGSGSRLFILADMGTFGSKRSEDWIMGTGFGLRLLTEQRPLTILLVSDPRGNWREPLVHIAFEMDTPWIDR